MRTSNFGIILIIVLWVLIFLSALAVSLGRKGQIEISLIKNAVRKTKAKYIAWAGIIRAMELIRKDSENSDSGKIDTQYYCGIPIEEGSSPAEIFSAAAVGDGVFQIAYLQPEDSEGKMMKRFGFVDEQRKINLNGLSLQNVNVFINFLELLDVDPESAQQIAFAVIDWVDTNDQPSDPVRGVEDEYYSTQVPAYHCKNMPIESLPELLLIRGITKELYAKMVNYVTIYPPRGDFKINFNTASGIVLQALARSFSGSITNTSKEDADSLITKLMASRRGDDGRDFSADDRALELTGLPLNSAERIIFLSMRQYQINMSDFFYVRSQGKDNNSRATATVEAIVHRRDLSIVSWHRN